MIRFEVQFLIKSSGKWFCYDITEDYQVAREKASFLNSEGYDARIISVVSTGVEYFSYKKKEV